MSRRDDRRAEQAADELDRKRNQRPNEPPRPLVDADRCPARLGGPHDFTMRGKDGNLRCWHCAQPSPLWLKKNS
jgi:hypothetical protein